MGGVTGRMSFMDSHSFEEDVCQVLQGGCSCVAQGWSVLVGQHEAVGLLGGWEVGGIMGSIYNLLLGVLRDSMPFCFAVLLTTVQHDLA